MAADIRSFCQLDLAPVLAASASESWTVSLRDHAARCFRCALRLGALERLEVRVRSPLEKVATRAATPRRRRSSKVARFVLGPVQRTAALAAVALVTTFLALAVGRGAGLASSLMLGGPAELLGEGPARVFSAALASEARARELARKGSPDPINLMPPLTVY
jgi:hypothetical protein